MMLVLIMNFKVTNHYENDQISERGVPVALKSKVRRRTTIFQKSNAERGFRKAFETIALVGDWDGEIG